MSIISKISHISNNLQYTKYHYVTMKSHPLELYTEANSQNYIWKAPKQNSMTLMYALTWQRVGDCHLETKNKHKGMSVFQTHI